MILLDPDLGPDPATAPAPRGRKVARPAAAGSVLAPRGLHLPSSRVLARFLAEAQDAIRLRGQVTVLLTTDGSIRRLNRRFRGKNKPTDVLSFPAEGSTQQSEKIAGDLAISVPAARRQAAEQGHRLLPEIKVLILHGLLHLAGYDHETDRGEMARRERDLRGRFGLPQGLIERAGIRSGRDSISRKKPESATSRRGLRIGPGLSPETRRKDGARSVGVGPGARIKP